MCADRLSLYIGALRELGERPLASLSENRAPRRYLDTAWNNGGVDKMLSQGQWIFARRSVQMAADAGLSPLFGWQYAFARPTDYLRALAVCADEFYGVPLEAYQEEDGVFYAAMTPFYLAYVSNDPNFGGNLAKWPPNFTTFAELWLANQIMPSLTGNKTDRADLEKRLHKALTRAQSTEAMENPTKQLPSGSWVNARLRGQTSRWDRGSRSQLIG